MMQEQMKKFDAELFQAELINLLISHGLFGGDITIHIDKKENLNVTIGLIPKVQILNIKVEL